MGDYQIIDIKKVKPAKDRLYFFDANVWVLILTTPSDLRHYEKPYITFFETLIELNPEGEDQFPKIIVTPLLLSEIFNQQMQSRFKQWKEFNGHSDALFKKDFRPTEEHDTCVRNFTSDFLSFQNWIVFKNDDMEAIDPTSLLESFPANTDFNDQCYYLQAYDHDWSIVTNDGDFLQPKVEIITNNKSLLIHV